MVTETSRRPSRDGGASRGKRNGRAYGPGLFCLWTYASGTQRSRLFDDHRIHRFICDRGRGFDSAVGDGHGQALPMRAAAIGATATVSSEPGSGTEVEILWEQE